MNGKRVPGVVDIKPVSFQMAKTENDMRQFLDLKAIDFSGTAGIVRDNCKWFLLLLRERDNGAEKDNDE